MMRTFSPQALWSISKLFRCIACRCVIEGQLPVRWVSHAGGDWQMYCHVDAHDFSEHSQDYENNIQLVHITIAKNMMLICNLYDLPPDRGLSR